jgi:hypothetical protein
MNAASGSGKFKPSRTPPVDDAEQPAQAEHRANARIAPDFNPRLGFIAHRSFE